MAATAPTAAVLSFSLAREEFSTDLATVDLAYFGNEKRA